MSQLQAVEGLGAKLGQKILQQRDKINLQQLSLIEEPLTTPGDRLYPKLLAEIPNLPPVLYYKGKNESLLSGDSPKIGIVGTRSPSAYGKRWTRRIASALVQHGFIIVSGMAEGIDTEAHSACLEAGGDTIAVLGTGVDVVYPPSNRKLYQQIIGQGLVVSEYSAGTRPNRAHFPARNRIIAGLAQAIIVTEAPVKSGALITAYVANEYGRDVYVLPGSLDQPNSRGCLELIDRGAHLILDEARLLEMLGTMPQLVSSTPSNPVATPNLTPQLQSVWDAIGTQGNGYDLIVQTSGLENTAVATALLELELMGLITQLAGMRYQRC